MRDLWRRTWTRRTKAWVLIAAMYVVAGALAAALLTVD